MEMLRSMARKLASSKKGESMGNRKDKAHKEDESQDLGTIIANKVRKFKAMKGISKKMADKMSNK